ncbi:MAG: hypothetical protein LIO55_04820, partial [Oscillospiraceae bacterium]|nr:hypothetical protein [Oscillospiraceae bacterium]
VLFLRPAQGFLKGAVPLYAVQEGRFRRETHSEGFPFGRTFAYFPCARKVSRRRSDETDSLPQEQIPARFCTHCKNHVRTKPHQRFSRVSGIRLLKKSNRSCQGGYDATY